MSHSGRLVELLGHSSTNLPLRRQDSNLDHRNQNPRCCLYTTADCWGGLLGRTSGPQTRTHIVTWLLRSHQRSPPSVLGTRAEPAPGADTLDTPTSSSACRDGLRVDNLRFS